MLVLLFSMLVLYVVCGLLVYSDLWHVLLIAH
jgi:hypothetical protein